MSSLAVFTHKLVNRTAGAGFTPADGIYRLGIAPDPSQTKNTRITAGMYIDHPGTELTYYQNGAYRPLSSQGAIITYRNMDPANPTLSVGASEGFRLYSHLIGHTDNPATALYHAAQVDRFFLPSGKGTYLLWLYVEYDAARAADLTISIASGPTLAEMNFPSTAKLCNLSAVYIKTSTSGEEVVWTYSVSPQPRIIRTAIVKTGDLT